MGCILDCTIIVCLVFRRGARALVALQKRLGTRLNYIIRELRGRLYDHGVSCGPVYREHVHRLVLLTSYSLFGL